MTSDADGRRRQRLRCRAAAARRAVGLAPAARRRGAAGRGADARRRPLRRVRPGRAGAGRRRPLAGGGRRRARRCTTRAASPATAATRRASRAAGPSLIGVGSAAVEFQVGTGRMPLARQEAQAERKPPQFTDERGPASSARTSRSSAAARSCPAGRRPARRRRRSASGGELFRVNCSSCHAFGGGGGALSSGKFAPEPGRGHRPGDLRRDADRPAEHAGLRRQPAHARRRSATSSPTSRT